MFAITCPGSPSVFSNMVTSIEHNAYWIADCVDFVRKHGKNSVEAE